MRPQRLWILLAVTVAIAFCWRCKTIGDVFLDGRILPYDPDSSSHLWRIETTVREGAPPRFDPFTNAPDGASVLWPDGFDGSVGWLIRLAAGADASRHTIETIALFLGPLLGALAVLGIFALGRRAFGTAAGLLAAGLAALFPASATTSFLGLVDHHVLELGLPPLALLGLLGERRAIHAGLAGLALAALAWSVPSAPLHLVVVSASVVAAGLAATAAEPARGRAMLQHLAIALATTCAATAPMALSYGGLEFWRASALPCVLAGAGSAVAAGLSLVAGRGARALLVALGVIAVGAGGVGVVLLRDAAGFVGRAGVLELVTETRPLWVTPETAIMLYSVGVLAVPIVGPLLARRHGPAAWGVTTAALLGLVLASFQTRFGPLAVPGVAIVIAAGVVALWARVPRRSRVLVALGGVVALVPSLFYWSALSLLGGQNLATLEVAEWLAAHTPDPGPRERLRPDYTILALWGDAGHLPYLAGRPVLAGAFYHGDYAPGVDDAIRALYGDDDPTPILERRRVRYVIVGGNTFGSEASHRELLGLPPSRARTLARQLYRDDGAAVVAEGTIVPARRDLRLVHDSPFTSAMGEAGEIAVPKMKIFERVAGARLAGNCAGPAVQARMQLTTDAGRPLIYLDQVACTDGRFALQVPYAGTLEVLTGPGQPPEAIAVSEDAVVGGLALR